jgi:hypothetical protein
LSRAVVGVPGAVVGVLHQRPFEGVSILYLLSFFDNEPDEEMEFNNTVYASKLVGEEHQQGRGKNTNKGGGVYKSN